MIKVRICLVKFGPFDLENVGDGANEPARVLNFHGLVTKERGGSWVGIPGGRGYSTSINGYWFETRTFFRPKNPKIQTLFWKTFTLSCFKVVY